MIDDPSLMATKYRDQRIDQIAGVILGTAVGDALGLPREGMSRTRGRKMFGGPPSHHHLVLGRGMISDDTEHTCMVGQALLRAPIDADAFARSLAWRLRFWLFGLPAGVGLATLRAVGKLWIGFSPANSGVYSAGNGPAMRAAILGVCLGQNLDLLRAYIRASTRLTHTDPKAERGAFLVALAAHHGAVHGTDGVRADAFFQEMRALANDLDAELLELLGKMEDHLKRDATAVEFADALGLQRGVTGYIYHSVPVALYCWLRHPGNYRLAIEEVIDLGGDTDSTAAIVGGIAGATVGAGGIPEEWIGGIWEWPRSVAWIRALALRLANQFSTEGNGTTQKPQPLFWPGRIPRNLMFLLIVLLHGFRRLLPPY
jgi:ADP-ribosyl-[dinitrogen reductase] hydrolase